MSFLSRILSKLLPGQTGVMTSTAPLETGAELPAVPARNQDGHTLNLAEAGTAGYLLVYFYPKADTPGCTRQACSLRDSYAALQEKGVKVIGASMDPAAAQKAFKKKYGLPFDLLADEEGEVMAAFGVPHTMGFARRQAFLFKDGKLVWRDFSASTAKQASDVLAAVAAGG